MIGLIHRSIDGWKNEEMFGWSSTQTGTAIDEVVWSNWFGGSWVDRSIKDVCVDELFGRSLIRISNCGKETDNDVGRVTNRHCER